jgi:hypothetical protein
VTDFPAGAFTALGLNYLVDWIANGKTPPPAKVPLPANTLKKLYPRRDQYVAAVERRLEELLAQGWFLPEYADMVRRDAQQAQLP